MATLAGHHTQTGLLHAFPTLSFIESSEVQGGDIKEIGMTALLLAFALSLAATDLTGTWTLA